MKHIDYSFSNSDIDTILFTLSILPSLDLEETEAQAIINYQLCNSAIEKLTTNPNIDISSNEFRIIFASLQAAQLIIKDELSVDSETKSECCKYIFSVNKLVSILEPYFS